MKLIKHIGTRRNSTGRVISYALFHCEYCKSDVEKNVTNGRRAYSCGCMRNKRPLRLETVISPSQERTCLCCGRVFMSRGPHNRRCEICDKKIGDSVHYRDIPNKVHSMKRN